MLFKTMSIPILIPKAKDPFACVTPDEIMANELWSPRDVESYYTRKQMLAAAIRNQRLSTKEVNFGAIVFVVFR